MYVQSALEILASWTFVAAIEALHYLPLSSVIRINIIVGDWWMLTPKGRRQTDRQRERKREREMPWLPYLSIHLGFQTKPTFQHVEHHGGLKHVKVTTDGESKTQEGFSADD